MAVIHFDVLLYYFVQLLLLAAVIIDVFFDVS